MESSSSSSAPARSSQPLHNFELPPLLKWNNKEGKSGGTHRRWRSMKPPHQRPNSFSASPLRRSPMRDSVTPPPAPRFETPIRDFAAAPPRHQTYPLRARESPVAAAEEEMKEAAVDDEFERLSVLREEAVRQYRGRDWWSESGKSDVIAYRRNPHKKSASPARLGSSSSHSEDRRSDAARGFDVYRRNPLQKSSFSGGGEVDEYNRSPPLRRSAFAFNSEEKKSDAYRRNPWRKTGFSSPTKQQQPLSLSSNSRMVEDDVSHPRNSNYYFRKSGFSSPNKPFSFNTQERKYKMAEADPKYPYFKKSGFSSPNNKSFSSSSYSEERDDACHQKPYAKKSEERKLKVGEGDSYSKIPLNKYSAAAYVSNSLEKNPKVADAGASPKKKSAVASAVTTTTTKTKIASSSNTPEEIKIEEKSKAPEAGAENPKTLAEGKDKQAAEIKDDSETGKQSPEKEMEVDDEEIKVWNLRPRNVKSKDKAKTGGGDKGSTCAAGSKNKAQPTKPAAGKSGGEKKEKKKLSIEISLTKHEIEEDIYALTGAKPSRRPKKRPKNVQKQLDSVFPGLWLVSITPESYKVSENSLKG